MERLSLLCVAIFLLTSCLETDSSGNDFATLQDLEIECFSAQATGCVSGNAGDTFYVGLSADTDMDCEGILSLLVPGQFPSVFDASSTPTATDGGISLNGNASAWVDSNSGSIGQLQRKTYKICAFLDLDGDQILDASEPVGTGSYTPGADNPSLLDDWFDSF